MISRSKTLIPRRLTMFERRRDRLETSASLTERPCRHGAEFRVIDVGPAQLRGVIITSTIDYEKAVRQVMVSNHGGRQLDGVCAGIDALPEVVEAVSGRCEVFCDGGIRRGTDVVKALALGAQAVLVGRPVLWGLAVDGAAGVSAVLECLRGELVRAMKLLDRPTIADIDATTARGSTEDMIAYNSVRITPNA